MGRLAKTIPFCQMMFKLQKKFKTSENNLKKNLQGKNSNFI